MKHVVILFCLVTLAGCGDRGLFRPVAQPADDPALAQTRPMARPDGLSAPPPPAQARTAEEFDTTSAAQREAASKAPDGAEETLGTTVASLGDPTRAGFWIETPLVTAPGKGRVLYGPSGQSAQVDLIPIDGPATAGSRLSLSAMRLIGAPLAGLPEVTVYRGG